MLLALTGAEKLALAAFQNHSLFSTDLATRTRKDIQRAVQYGLTAGWVIFPNPKYSRCQNAYASAYSDYG